MNKKLDILQHSLGLDQYGGGNQHRNHFVTGEGGINHALCSELVADGLMKNCGSSAITGGDDCFVVTAQGIDYVALNSPVKPPPPKLTRSQQNYQRYLDSECDFSFAEWMGFGRHKPYKSIYY